MCPSAVFLVRCRVSASFVADSDQAKERALLARTLAAPDRRCRARSDEAVARFNINGNVLPKVALFAIALVLGSVDHFALFGCRPRQSHKTEYRFIVV